MHEFSLTEAIFTQVLQQARDAGAEHVTDVYLVIGELDHAVDESLQFYWDLLSHDTLAAGARLHIRRTPAVYRCERCGREYPAAGEIPTCPSCHSLRARQIAGDEFYLEALDIVPGADATPALLVTTGEAVHSHSGPPAKAR